MEQKGRLYDPAVWGIMLSLGSIIFGGGILFNRVTALEEWRVNREQLDQRAIDKLGTVDSRLARIEAILERQDREANGG